MTCEDFVGMPPVNIRNKEGPPETEIEAVRRHACEAKHRVARQEALLAIWDRTIQAR